MAEYLTREELKRVQEKRLRAIVNHAYRNTRFWHEWFDSSGIKPSDIQRIEDLVKLPVCTKQDLLRRPIEDRLAEDPANCVRISTSGTTGGPMPVYQSKEYNDYVSASSRFRLRRALGFGLFDKILGIHFKIPKKVSTEHGGRMEHGNARRQQILGMASPILGPIVDHYNKKVFLSYSIEEVLPEIIEFKPHVIRGSVSYLRLLAEAVRERGVKGIEPKVLTAGGEVFDENSRRFLEDTFSCNAYDVYGAFDIGPLAYECREKVGMHIWADALVMEILKDGQQVAPGEAGDVVVTGLLNDAMPMLRYRLGDIGVPSDDPCPCGRTLPMLKSVEGRAEDHLTRSRGGTVSPMLIVSLMHSIIDLPRCQVVQEALNRFRLRVFVQGQREIQPSVSKFLVELQRVLGDDVTIDVSVEKPERLRAKFRPVVSLLNVSSSERWVRPY